jgi:hypothetical protein
MINDTFGNTVANSSSNGKPFDTVLHLTTKDLTYQVLLELCPSYPGIIIATVDDIFYLFITFTKVIEV